MQTGNLLRDDISHDYAGSVRLWGLVNGNLMWTGDPQTLRGKLHKHASAELRKTSLDDRRFPGYFDVRFLDGEEPIDEPGSEPTAYNSSLSAPADRRADSFGERCTFRD